ncbi:protein of unknown function (plasmid) [Caballeronia sp. S22]
MSKHWNVGSTEDSGLSMDHQQNRVYGTKHGSFGNTLTRIYDHRFGNDGATNCPPQCLRDGIGCFPYLPLPR